MKLKKFFCHLEEIKSLIFTNAEKTKVYCVPPLIAVKTVGPRARCFIITANNKRISSSTG